MTSSEPGSSIEEVLDGFDFEKVQQVMRALDWKWFDSGEIPTIDRMRETVRDLYRHTLKFGEGSCRTGGFRLQRWKDGHCRLSFEAVSSE